MKTALNLNRRVVVSKDGKELRVRQLGHSDDILPESHNEIKLYDVDFDRPRAHGHLAYEYGFGCGIAALGCIMTMDLTEEEKASLQPIYFDGRMFFRLGDWKNPQENDPVIDQCRFFIVNADGSMLASTV